jgi:hypothetical protein
LRQPAHDPEAQLPHDPPLPAITPLLLMAANREIARCARSCPHFGQAIGASAADIERSASKRASHSWQQYSYNGIFVVLSPEACAARAGKHRSIGA